MKSYKIKYGGYYQKSEDKFDDNEEHLKEPLDYRPIIFNNIYWLFSYSSRHFMLDKSSLQ